MLALKEAKSTFGLMNVDLLAAVSMGATTNERRGCSARRQPREAVGVSMMPSVRADYDRGVAATRAGLGEAAFDAAWAEGKTMPPERAVEYALEQSPKPEEAVSASYPAGLSPREADVLKLVARGMTNAQVARELFISPNTLNRHLNSVYRKIGANSRAAATGFATEHRLA